MNWLKRLFGGAELESVRSVWIHVNPAQPHAGIAQISEDKKAPWKPAIKVDGIGLAEARLDITGKVLAWDRLTEAQVNGLSGKDKTFSIHVDDMKKLFR